VFGVLAGLAHMRDAECPVVVDIDADERLADRDRDGDRGRVNGVHEAVGDQFTREQKRIPSGGMPTGRLPDELPCCRRGADVPGEALGLDVLMHARACCRPHRWALLPAASARYRSWPRTRAARDGLSRTLTIAYASLICKSIIEASHNCGRA